MPAVWNILAQLKELIAGETLWPHGEFSAKDPGGRLKVALLWPDTYRTGMSALGYLSIYALLNGRDDVLAERFFWPDSQLALSYERSNSPLLSLESGRPLAEFDLIAASLSVENDFWRLPAMLAAGGLEPWRDKREAYDPPVLVGGVGVWANPWPLFDFADLVLTGEAEGQWPLLISAWKACCSSPLPKEQHLSFLCRETPGTLLPGPITELLVSPNEEFRANFSANNPQVISDSLSLPVSPSALKWPPPSDMLPPVSPILSPNAEFADTLLVEISRGCPYGCRFCLAGVLYRPHRPWPMARILKAIGGVDGPTKIGLVSPAAGDHPELPELLETLFSWQKVVTLSSLRLSKLTPKLAEMLAAGKLYGVAVAPEGGSQALRNIINKDLTEEVILNGVAYLTEAHLRKIKLYFMIGLPGETDEDLRELVSLAEKIRAVAQRGKAKPELVLSLANFTPKAHTPFEEAPMATEAEFKRKGRLVANALKKVPRLSVQLDPPRWSIVQGILARGGPESSRLVASMWQNEGRLKPALAAIGYTPEHPIHRPWPKGQAKPWRVVNPGAGLEFLQREMERSAGGVLTPACPPGGACGRCGGCGPGYAKNLS